MTDSLLRRAHHVLAPLQRRDLAAAYELCAYDPVAAVVPAMHLETARDSGVVPSGLWVLRRRGGRDVDALVWNGANLTAVLAPAEDEVREAVMADLAAAAVGRLSRPAAIVGEASVALDLWGRVEPWWGPAREVRANQVSMRIDGPARHIDSRAREAGGSAHQADSPARNSDGPGAAEVALESVRRATMADYDVLLPACVHMFIGEVGYDPMRHGRAAYEDRLRYLVRAGRAYVQFGIVDGRREVVFKAEVGAVGGGVAQLQGVWVHPHLRGRGLARAGLAAVIAAVRAEHAPTASLYVNDFNGPAIAAYEAVGMRPCGSFATVMF